MPKFFETYSAVSEINSANNQTDGHELSVMR
jgi:hypothetical protein